MERTVCKLDFSFDYGATRVEYPIENADTQRWVYRKMDISSITKPDACLMRIQATSRTTEGEPRESFYLTNFMFDVQKAQDRFSEAPVRSSTGAFHAEKD